jgi:hypothetical protein
MSMTWWTSASVRKGSTASEGKRYGPPESTATVSTNVSSVTDAAIIVWRGVAWRGVACRRRMPAAAGSRRVSIAVTIFSARGTARIASVLRLSTATGVQRGQWGRP